MQIVCDALNPPHVTSLAIVGPRYNGTIPISLDKLSALSNLTIQNTYFRGVIPTQFGSLVNLKVLQIKNNSLVSGGVPTELALLNSLEVLDLSGNNLIGTFPEIIEVACKNLVYLDISGNENLVDIDTLTIYNTLSYILFVVTFLILAALYLFIYLCEIRDVQRKRLNWAKARTTFNITLTIMSLSVMAAASAQLATSIKDISAQASIENVLQLAFKATFTHCYILNVCIGLLFCVPWFYTCK
ncbi:hypothetical protein HDU79_005026 [Rhizoclosmatium sp. JEL0117]|nr:hypothetical protein HDU79_005026 [Rhizoclosmatium sp. JEL0117]